MTTAAIRPLILGMTQQDLVGYRVTQRLGQWSVS
jgi:hypothetical protein